MNTSRSLDNLKELLTEQVAFLKASCQSFDNGFGGESKRIATTVRVLVHDTNQSQSLLKQLNLKSIDFYNTSAKLDPKNFATHMGLVFMRMELLSGDSEYLPYLDDFLPDSMCLKKFDDWWLEPVIVDKNHNIFTRKDLILATSNKEGGAHVDPKLDIKFENLLRNNSINWYIHSDIGTEPFGKENIQLVMASIRQIGFEMLKTLEKYSK
jgi:hypothetical protein